MSRLFTFLQISFITYILVESISTHNCSLPDTDDRYGDLGGDEYATMSETNPQCQMNNTLTNAFSVAGSTTVYPVSKVWAIEYFECAHKGCAQITVQGGGSTDGMNSP